MLGMYESKNEMDKLLNWKWLDMKEKEEGEQGDKKYPDNK